MDGCIDSPAPPPPDRERVSSGSQAGNVYLLRSNLVVGRRGSGRRTSIRLEAVFWEALDNAADILELDRHEIATRVSRAKCRGLTLTSALRIFVLTWWLALPRDGSARALAKALDAVASPAR